DAGDAFHRAMNDDFNTAGAIAALFDFAAAINRFIEQKKLESPGGLPEPQASARANDSVQRESLPSPNAQQSESLPSPEPQASACANPRTDALAATQFLMGLARLIGLFLEPIEKKSSGDDGVTDAVMQILIQIRQHVRGKKDFETADMIRDLLKERNIALEDRPDGTIWRLE
ncbi:MAG: hypothetical protein IIC01_07135, partial [Planctomycetes bacterium]|nr:hypothetical protein [Planctomycetota bacterium]